MQMTYVMSKRQYNEYIGFGFQKSKCLKKSTVRAACAGNSHISLLRAKTATLLFFLPKTGFYYEKGGENDGFKG